MEGFYKRAFKLALPMALQQFISISVNFVDTLMIGQLGEIPIAAVGLSNKVFFLYSLLLFGLCSGGSIFIAQFWGKKDFKNISKSMSIMAVSSVIFSSVFFVMGAFFPHFTMRIFSPDIQVINQGAVYLFIIAFSIPFTGLTNVYEATLKSTEHPVLPMAASLIALSGNIFLNWVFIFGNLGSPKLGVQGAAIATLISRIVQFLILMLASEIRKYPARFRMGDIKAISLNYLKAFFSYTIPTIGNEFLWSLGTVMYSIVYAHMSTQTIAARNVMETVESFAFALLFALAGATAIMIGKELGQSNYENARMTAKKMIVFTVMISTFTLSLVLIFAKPMLGLFQVDDTVRKMIFNTLIISMVFVPIKTINLVGVVGILRAGGDTKFAFCTDVGAMWIIGVPMAFLAGILLKLPFELVYLFTMGEEVFKSFVLFFRLRSGKWIKNVVDAMQEI